MSGNFFHRFFVIGLIGNTSIASATQADLCLSPILCNRTYWKLAPPIDAAADIVLSPILCNRTYWKRDCPRCDLGDGSLSPILCDRTYWKLFGGDVVCFGMNFHRSFAIGLIGNRVFSCSSPVFAKLSPILCDRTYWKQSIAIVNFSDCDLSPILCDRTYWKRSLRYCKPKPLLFHRSFAIGLIGNGSNSSNRNILMRSFHRSFAIELTESNIISSEIAETLLSAISYHSENDRFSLFIFMPEFNHQPSIQVLQALVGASFAELNNLNKAVRLWYTLRELGAEFQPAQFTDQSWREHLYKSPDRNRDNKPEQIDGCLCTKAIADILFDRAQDKADLWSSWKQSLQASLMEYYGARDLPEIAERKLADYLIALELEKPFYVTGRTILGDLQGLAKIPKISEDKYLISVSFSEFQLPPEFPSPIVQTTQIDRSRLIISAEEPRSLQDPAYLTGDFSSFAYLFAEPTREIQRFHIHADYHTPKDKLLEVNQYLRRLRENWSKDRSTPCQLQYHSSSQIGVERRYTIVVYPVCLYYYQRAFYLCAFGLGFEAKYEWHNYRLDRIERLEDLNWQQHRDIIPQLLFDTCDRVDDLQLLDIVKSGLEEAYGFDFYRKSREMVLRFDREFHDRYIANTFRHQTFQPISKQGLLKADPNLAGMVDRYPDGAFYTMNYRVGDNSVIMRLRAWGQNVEVLSPPELRDRMRDDIRQTWALYNGDPDRG